MKRGAKKIISKLKVINNTLTPEKMNELKRRNPFLYKQLRSTTWKKRLKS